MERLEDACPSSSDALGNVYIPRRDDTATTPYITSKESHSSFAVVVYLRRAEDHVFADDDSSWVHFEVITHDVFHVGNELILAGLHLGGRGRGHWMKGESAGACNMH